MYKIEFICYHPNIDNDDDDKDDDDDNSNCR